MEIALIVSMVGTLLLMLPVSWGYMGARRVTGFDQAVVQTVVILPMAVAGIVVMVKTASPWPSALPGSSIRNSLSDTANALYIFLAIGVGLAAGIGELGVAAVISIVLNYVILTLWKSDFGVCPNGGPKNGWSARAADVQEKKKEEKREKKKLEESAELAGVAGSSAATDPMILHHRRR
ncbi:MAG: hypothetical protein VYD18_12930 [Candidatus Latescibacterota bacterium]|nr:hypothetical protein [Candidatus Latescibacterota bacterium]